MSNPSSSPEGIDREDRQSAKERFLEIKRKRASILKEPVYRSLKRVDPNAKSRKYRTIHIGHGTTHPSNAATMGDLIRVQLLRTAAAKARVRPVHIIFENGARCDKWIDSNTGMEIAAPDHKDQLP